MNEVMLSDEGRRLAVYCKFRYYFRDGHDKVRKSQAEKIAVMFGTNEQVPSSKQRRKWLTALEEGYRCEKQRELSRRMNDKQRMSRKPKDISELLWVVLTKGVDWEAYPDMDTALD